MKYNDLVSVIVPVYNVEKYLKKCISSIVVQTYVNIEILLVDDGSTDNSGKICDMFAQNDDRIKVYHKENGGLSSARNYGIEQAKGEFITFIDSDDYISERFIEILMSLIKKYSAEIAFLGVELVDEYGHCVLKKDGIAKEGIFNHEQALKEMCLNRKTGVSACAKIYKIALFDDIRYPIGKLYEDIRTTPYLFAKAKIIAYSTQRLYYYVQRNTSIMHRTITDKDYVLFDAFDELLDFIDKNFPAIHSAAVVRIVNDTFWTFMKRLIYNKDYLRQAKKIRKKYKHYWIESLKYKELGKGKKIQIVIALCNLRIYKVLRKFYNLKG